MPNPRPTAVGGFVLGGLVIIAAAILFFGGGEVFEDKTLAVAYFEGSVGGLLPGAPVTFRGVQVGSVRRVALIVDPSQMQARIPVYLQLERDRVTLTSGPKDQPLLNQLIEAGLRAKLVPQSFVTGQLLVELDLAPGTPAHRSGDADLAVPEIPTIPSDLDELRQELTQAPIGQTITQALHTLAAIERVADHLDGEAGTLDEAQQTLAAIQRVVDHFDAEIGTLAASAHSVLDDAGHTVAITGDAVQRLEQGAARTLDETQALAQDGRRQLNARGDELSRTLADAGKALKAISDLADSANLLFAPRSQARTDLEAILRDLAASANDLRNFSQTIDRDPSVVLRGRASQ
jgi:paraquat-inducible protein B